MGIVLLVWGTQKKDGPLDISRGGDLFKSLQQLVQQKVCSHHPSQTHAHKKRGDSCLVLELKKIVR